MMSCVVKEMAAKKVDEAMKQHLNKYPDAADLVSQLERLRVQAEFWDRMRNQAVTTPDLTTVANASKDVVQVEGAETPLESITQQVTPIAKYPGEGQNDAGDGQSSRISDARVRLSPNTNPKRQLISCQLPTI